LISRELYRAAVEAYIQHLRFKRDVAKEVQRLMGVSSQVKGAIFRHKVYQI